MIRHRRFAEIKVKVMHLRGACEITIERIRILAVLVKQLCQYISALIVFRRDRIQRLANAKQPKLRERWSFELIVRIDCLIRGMIQSNQTDLIDIRDLAQFL